MSTTSALCQHDDAVQAAGAAHSREVRVCAGGCRQLDLSGLSHELRTPLNAMLGFSQLLRTLPQEQLDSERGRAYLEHIESSGWQLLQVIDALLQTADAQRWCQPLHSAQPCPCTTGACPAKAT